MTRSRTLAAAAVVATTVLGAQTWHKAFRDDGNDLTSYLLAARALWDGQSPYGLDTPFPYLYPLFLAFVILPFALLPYGAAVIGWFAATVAALGLILREWSSRNALAIAATAVITFNVIQNNLLNGQVNFFVVLCCVAAVAAATNPPSAFAHIATADKEGGYYEMRAFGAREAAAGAWLGAGIALKLMPVVLLMYLLVRRQFRAIAIAIVVALVLALAPALLMIGSGSGAESGFSRIADVYSRYAREFLVPMMTSPTGDGLAFSIAGVVQRASGMGPAFWLELLCAAAVLGTVAGVDLARWRRRGDHCAAAAAYLAAIILISPKSETHHLAFAVPAVALCVSRVFDAGVGFTQAADGQRLRAARGPALTLLVSAVAMVAAPFSGAAEGPMVTAAMILLIAAVTAVSRRSIPR